MTTLAYCVSFFFAARIREVARRSNAALIQSDSGPLVEETLRAHADLVLLEIERVDLAEVERVKAHPALHSVRVVGFGAHVEEQLFARARQAGCDAVFTKGELARRLAELFAGT